MKEMVEGALQILRTGHDDFVYPRYDIMLVAASCQQRRAWLTALRVMPDWVWLHNAPLCSEFVDHGVLTDNTWHVDEEYYKVHHDQDLRQKCLEELQLLLRYTEKGYCAEDGEAHEEVHKAKQLLMAREQVLAHYEGEAAKERAEHWLEDIAW